MKGIPPQELLNYFSGTWFQLFYDQDSTKRNAPVFNVYDEKKFHELNEQKFGVYFSVNSFSNNRDKTNLIKLLAVYADIDISKDGDSKALEQKTQEKRVVYSALTKLEIKPNFITLTKNGVQPIWLIDEDSISEEIQALYTNTIKGVGEWAKRFGGKNDKVYDVARVLRLPCYFHQKSDPFMVETFKIHEAKTSLQALQGLFPYFDEKLIEDDNAKTYKESEELASITWPMSLLGP